MLFALAELFFMMYGHTIRAIVTVDLATWSYECLPSHLPPVVIQALHLNCTRAQDRGHVNSMSHFLL